MGISLKPILESGTDVLLERHPTSGKLYKTALSLSTVSTKLSRQASTVTVKISLPFSGT
jgi:hypothetical protein